MISAGSALAVLTVLVVPTLFWAGYHYFKDRHRAEPLRFLGLTYVLGIGSGLLADLLYQLLFRAGLGQDVYVLAEVNRPAFLAYAVLAVGGIEETAKLLPFVWIVRRLHHFDELVDGVIYASFVALGFATFENIVYAREVDSLELAARSVASPVVHVVFASIWGHFIAAAMARGRRIWPSALAGLAASIFLHGVYDFLLIGVADHYRLVAALLLAGGWFWRLHVLERSGHVELRPVRARRVDPSV